MTLRGQAGLLGSVFRGPEPYGAFPVQSKSSLCMRESLLWQEPHLPNECPSVVKSLPTSVSLLVKQALFFSFVGHCPNE